LAIICVGDGWQDMRDFGEAKEEWLGTFLDLKNGIPSADTFSRVLSALDPKAFNEVLTQWVRILSGGTNDKVVAVDGKTVRHSFDRATNRKALHLVSAWIVENNLCLGQIATEEKSNEITAIPKLLELLDIRGATITLDAMGCQRAIADKIIKQDCDYIMGLKRNQGSVRGSVERNFFLGLKGKFEEGQCTFHETTNEGEHGRKEVRRVWVTHEVDRCYEYERWNGLKSLIMVERERTVGTKTSLEKHYYLSSHEKDATALGAMIRDHWSIENQLHWCLDVAFREDESRIRIGNGPENIALLRKLAMNLAKNEKSNKRGIQAKRKRAAWDNN
jgi:predicted transposase YbfD/YdcC